MTIKHKMEQLLKTMPSDLVRKHSNTTIAMYYYEYYHFNMANKSVADYSVMVNKREVPALESITRALRKCREENPSWKRDSKVVEDAKEYIRNESRS